MTADYDTAGLLGLGHSAPQDLVDGLRAHFVGRHAHDIQSDQWTASHCIDVGKGVCSSDLSVQKGLVHDGCKKIHRLHQRTLPIKAENASVVRRSRSDQEPRIEELR